jgi:hypothetical protein
MHALGAGAHARGVRALWIGAKIGKQTRQGAAAGRARALLGRRRPRLIKARAAPARYHELAGRVEMSLMERAPGADVDRVGVEGRTSMAVRMRSDELQRRRFEFFAPSHISWPVVDDKARPLRRPRRSVARWCRAADAPVPVLHCGMSFSLATCRVMKELSACVHVVCVDARRVTSSKACGARQQRSAGPLLPMQFKVRGRAP